MEQEMKMDKVNDVSKDNSAKKVVQKDDAKMDHSKMDHSKMQHGSNPKMGMEGHDHNMMIADFKKRFFVVLILTVPIMLLSMMIQKFLGVNCQFTSSQYILFTISPVVFFNGLPLSFPAIICMD